MTFKEARHKLEEIAAGRYCETSVAWRGGGQIPLYIECSVYIETPDSSHLHGAAKTWEGAFYAMEDRIRTLNSDYTPEALTAGVDEAVQEVAL